MRQRWRHIEAISQDLAARERAAGLAEHRPPDPTFAAVAYAWVAGEGFAEVVVDEGSAHAAYANFARVTATPEEVIIDFGLNPQPVGVPKDPISVKQRIIVNYYTAKRLLAALQMSVQRHEAVFGVLETDIQKRLKARQ